MLKKTVLVVDDEKVIRDLIHRTNDFYGIETLEAVDGESGVELYREFHPDLVVSDIHMPKMSGLALVKEIRQIDPKARVILITGYGHSKDLITAQTDKPNGFVEKPFTIKELSQQIESVLADVDSFSTLEKPVVQRN